MNVPKRIIIYNNTEYEVCEWAIEEATKYGLEFNDEYITYLLQNDAPDYSWGLTLLTHSDILNRKYIGSDGLLGRVVKLSKNGTVLDSFESVFDACMDALNGDSMYSFESLYNNGIAISKDVYDFFGITIKVKPINAEYELISELNKVVRKNRNRYYGKNKIFRKMYTDKVASKMTYDEYVMQGMRYHAFQFGNIICNLLRSPEESRYTKHIIEKCDDYSERMDILLQKYSANGSTAFEHIADLNKVKGCVGIYLLCLPQIKGCYVGKTEKSFSVRITQHFTNPNSAFDKKYKPADVKDIYILQLDETIPLIDYVEEDCIATLGKEICLNALAGGNSIDLIKSDTYDPKQHMLDSKLLHWVVEDSLNITQYRHECASDNI